jgi:hypothetical protein
MPLLFRHALGLESTVPRIAAKKAHYSSLVAVRNFTSYTPGPKPPHALRWRLVAGSITGLVLLGGAHVLMQ